MVSYISTTSSHNDPCVWDEVNKNHSQLMRIMEKRGWEFHGSKLKDLPFLTGG